jgi:hypothetical protein
LGDCFLGGAPVLHAIARIGNALVRLFPDQRFAPAVAAAEPAGSLAEFELRFAGRRAAGVLNRRTTGINALEKGFRAGLGYGADAGIALRGRFAAADDGKERRKHDPAILAHGAKPSRFSP